MTPTSAAERGGLRFPPTLPVLASIFAAALQPPLPLVPSKWAAQHLRVVKGPRAGGAWDPGLTPYVAEIIDALGPEAPHNMVAVRKSAQTGISVAGLALVASYMALRPNTDIGYAVPTIDLLQEFNRDRLQPTIETTPALRARVRPQVSRAGEGSTATSKLFVGGSGSLTLINANSAADLRSKSLKIGIGDEVDEWARDLEKQGDPWELFLNRFISFHATADWKVAAISTPTLDGGSRIDELFKRGDQRFWNVRCPHCGEEIVLLFKHLQFERRPPYRAHYAAQCCGALIEHFQKSAMVRAGRFVATNAGGLYPSFHIDALISQLTTWDHIADKALEAEANERMAMTFHNTWLGLPYAIKGDAPDWQRLFERREGYAENTVPPLGLILVAGADVQHSGIWVEIVAFAPDRQSWTVRAEFLAGDTTDPNLGAFAALAKVYDEAFVDAWGNRRRLDALAIDAGDGGRANQVYAFARLRSRARAVKGVPGWTQPAIAGQPTRVTVSLAGRRLQGGALVWPVGTWSLKAELYDNLRKDGRKSGAELDPPGYCHHGEFLAEQYFRQLTAESLADTKVRGRTVKIWKEHRPNHLLDCRIYAMALAEQLGLTRKTKEQWHALAQVYSMPVGADDLFAPPAIAVERSAPNDPQVAADFARALDGKQAARLRRGGRRVRSRGIA